MIKWLNLVFLVLHLSSLHGRLVFEPGSDMGYIVPDASYEEDESQLKESQITDAEQFMKVKSHVKRAFWNSVLNGFGKNAHYNDLLTETSESPESSSHHSTSGIDASRPFDLPENLKDDKHGVAMGISDSRCDDGKTDIELDWDGSPTNFTCYSPKRRLSIHFDRPPVETCDFVPPNYTPQHHCMAEKIVYNSSIPTVGPHRPLWPVFGEYRFVPPQRWLHSIEHGSVVMLYHPCAEPVLVNRLKRIVRDCIFKHVITASNLVPVEKPLVLVAWGCKLEMSFLDESRVVSFIRERGLHGPEGTLPKQGSYRHTLLREAVPLPGSGNTDSNLCPSF